MDIIKIRQEERAARIKQIFNRLLESNSAGKELDYDLFRKEICVRYNCSGRVAKEYLDLAIIKISGKVEDGKIVGFGKNQEGK